MGLYHENLDEITRGFMEEEIARDVKNGKLYRGTRFNLLGQEKYPELLIEAVRNHDDDWLASRMQPYLNQTETRTSSKGKTTVAKVPYNAATMFGEGEFNRYYLRGLCLRAMDEGVAKVKIYRGKEVVRPRTKSTMMIGSYLPVKTLLEDLRTNIAVDTALGLPPGPNSGLTAMLPNL